MAKKKEDEATKTVELNINPTLPPVWVDNLYVAKRKDDICLLRFGTELPEGAFEQVQFMTSKKKLEVFVDLICSHIGHYPTPSTDDDKEKREKK